MGEVLAIIKDCIQRMKREILPPTYFFLFLVFLIVSHIIFPNRGIIPPRYRYIGIILIICGVILNIWADALFKRSKTTVKPNEMPDDLIVSGPFKISRHPMYLGMTIILLGLAVLLNSITAFIFPIAFVILMEKKFVSLEEKYLEMAFRDKYLGYKQKVRRWI
jgi:protein-S-isoprenylcysteine O-methyltransferase Ste14